MRSAGLFWATRVVLVLGGGCFAMGQSDSAADLIERGHWKRARSIVEARLQQDPNDAAAYFYLSQIRNAFGDHASPLRFAEKAVALDGKVARFHRQIAEVTGVMAQHANAFQQLLLARRFRKEIDTALELDVRDVQALRDLMEFYLLAPGIAGGDRAKARATAERITALDEAEGCLAKARIAGFEHRAADVEVWLRKAVQVQPPSYKARMELARFYLAPDHTRPGLAESAAKSALRMDPGRAEAYAVLAEVYAAQSRWSELDALLDDSARMVSDDPIAFYRAAERIRGADSAVRAEQYLRVYLAQEPEGNEPTLADAQQILARVEHRKEGTAMQTMEERVPR